MENKLLELADRIIQQIETSGCITNGLEHDIATYKNQRKLNASDARSKICKQLYHWKDCDSWLKDGRCFINCKDHSDQPEVHLPDINNTYCVKRHMFFAVTDPIIESNLNLGDADRLCRKLNGAELDNMYVFYQVHNCNEI